MSSSVNSAEVLQLHFRLWTFLGVVREPLVKSPLYLLYALAVNLLVTVCFPLHLMLGIFSTPGVGNIFRNFALSVTSLTASLKLIAYAVNQSKVHQVNDILARLDSRVRGEEELTSYRRTRQVLRYMAVSYEVLYAMVGVTAMLFFVARGERTLIYPAVVPINWQESNVNYSLAILYEIMSIAYCLLQNMVDDSFASMTMCLLAEHIQLLSLRVAKIGHDQSDEMHENARRSNEEELKCCIRDKRNLYRLFELIQTIISLPMFMQFIVTALNICLVMVALLFYMDDPMERIYFAVYLAALPVQIFPTCYYGTSIQALFGRLPQAIYSSNWVYQSASYKRSMLVFVEHSKTPITARAGGLVGIHLDTFVQTCRGAYSLFTLVLNMKN